jgi:hypothetical protein
MGNPAPVLVPHGVDALLAPGVTTPRLTAWRLDCRAYPHQRDRLRLRPQPTNGVNERLLRYTHSAKVIGRVAVSRPRASLSLRARVQKPTTIAPTPLALALADGSGGARTSHSAPSTSSRARPTPAVTIQFSSRCESCLRCFMAAPSSRLARARSNDHPLRIHDAEGENAGMKILAVGVCTSPC